MKTIGRSRDKEKVKTPLLVYNKIMPSLNMRNCFGSGTKTVIEYRGTLNLQNTKYHNSS